MFHLLYPPEEKSFAIVRNTAHLRELLDAVMPPRLTRCCYRIAYMNTRKEPSKFIVCRCRQPRCRAMLKYSYHTDHKQYEIMLFHNTHLHYPRSTQQFELARNEVCSLVEQGSSNEQIISVIQKKFETIKEPHIWTFIRKVRKDFKSESLFVHLQKLGLQAYSDPLESAKKPNEDFRYVLISKAEWISRMPAETEVLHLQVQMYSRVNGRIWGAFAAYVEGLQFKCMAFFIINISQCLKDVIKGFIKLTNFHPRVLITSHGPLIDQAVTALRLQGHFKGIHLLQYNSVLDSLESQGLSEHKRPYLRQIAIEPQNVIFHERLQALIDEQGVQQSQDKGLIQQFIRLSDRFCYSQIKVNNIGLNCVIDHFGVQPKCIMSRLKKNNKNYAFSTNIRLLVGYMMAYEKQYSKEVGGLDEFFTKMKIQELYFMLKPQVGMNFLDNYLLTLQLYPTFQKQGIYHVHSPSHSTYYEVHLILNRWICQCSYSAKSGLPCPHEISVCLATNSPLSQQIHSYWKSTNNKENNTLIVNQ